MIEKLRQKGYRITPQRIHIAEAIAKSDRHLSAEEILARVEQHTADINLATVYRTLELLTAQGLISRLNLGDGCVVYAAPRHGPHIHLVCRLCGKVIEADPEILAPLGRSLAEQYNFQTDLRHISLPGVCGDCQTAANT